MIVEKLLELPPWLIIKEFPCNAFKKVQVNFELFKNGSAELRICYTCEDGEFTLPWDAETSRDWIFLVEGIRNDNDVIDAVNWIHHELIKLSEYFENPYENSLMKT